MSTGRIDAGPPPVLLGVELGRRRVRLAVLDDEGRVLHDATEVPIEGDDQHVELLAAATSRAIAAGVGRLGLTPATPVRVGATIGFPYCGVGSGPALPEWLVELSRELGEPVVYIGEHGVSYAPVHCLDYVDQVFRSVPLRLDRVELAPLAASRTLGLLRTGTVRLGSGIAWSARILDGEMMEAFEAGDGPVDEVLHVVTSDDARPVQLLDGVFIDGSLSHDRDLSPGALAPAVGVAVALLDPPGRNLLDGRLVDAAARRAGGGRGAPRPQPSPLASPPDAGGDPGVAGPPPRTVRPAPDRPRPSGPDPDLRPGTGARGAPTRRPAPSQPDADRSADFLIGALLMLTVLLTIALVLP